MLRKLTFAAALGAGYVLGAKAGTQRYEQIMAKARELAGKPAVQDLRDNVSQHATEAASALGDKAKSVASDAVDTVAAKVTGGAKDNDAIDLTGPTTPASRATGS